MLARVGQRSQADHHMSKPITFDDVSATREAFDCILGPRLGRLFVPRPGVSRYDSVIVFKRQHVALSNQVRQAIEKFETGKTTVLLVGRDFTVEARTLAAQTGCDILCEHEFGWPDAMWLKTSEE